MAVTARDLKNDDTTDVGYDLLLDPTTIGAATGDVGITRILLGDAGANGGFVGSSNSLPVDIASSTVDVMLGTDFSAVLGSASLVATDGSAALTIGLQALGTDGTNAQILSTNSSGHVNIADGGNSITIDGSVSLTGNLPDTAAGDLAAINTAVSGTLTVGSHAVTNAGTFAVQLDGSALTALQLIDDIVHSGDAAVSKYAVLGAVYDDATPGTVTENQAQSLRMSAERYLYTEIRDAGGNERGLVIDASGYLTANINGTVTVDASGTAVPVTDNGGSLTVDGTVTANLSATDNAVLDQIEVNTSYGDSVGGGTEAAALRVTIASDSTGLVSVDDGGSTISIDDGGGNISTDWAGTAPPIGAGLEATALRVTVATDSTGVLSIDDNGSTISIDDGGGAITIDGTVTANLSATDNAVLDAIQTATELIDDAIHAEAAALSKGVLIALDDGTDAQFAQANASGHLKVDIATDTVGIGGGTQYAVDTALGATPTGTLAIAIRDDALSSLTPVEGDGVGLRVDANGALWMIPSGTVTVTDDGSFTLAANSGVDIGDVTINNASIAVTSAAALDVSAATVTVDSELPAAAALADNAANPTAPAVGAFAMVWDGATWDRLAGTSADGVLVNLGSNNDVTLATLPDTGSSDLAAINTATAATQTAVELIDDTVATLGTTTYSEATTKGVTVGAVRNDVLAALANTDNEIAPLQVNASGALYVQEGSALDVSAATVTVDLGANNDIQGDIAHDAIDSGNPLKLGAKAETAISGVTLVADADRTDLHAGVDGVLITRNHCNLEDIVAGNASDTGGSSTEVIAAAGAGVKQYLTSCTVTNTSSTDTYCEIKSGTTVRWTFPVPANGGVTHTWDPPLPPNAANEAWNFDMGAAVSTAYCSLAGFKSKV